MAMTMMPNTTWVKQPAAYSGLTSQQREALSGLTEFERISLRMWGHDINDDGRNDGSVYLKTLLNPVGSDNEPFVKTPTALRTVLFHMLNDLKTFGKLTGYSLRQEFANIYQKVTGHSIMPQLAQAPIQVADTSLANIFRKAPDMQTPQGWMEFLQRSGFSTQEALNVALWGHDAVDQLGAGGRNIDGSVLLPSLNDPTSIDNPLVQNVPGARAYVQNLILRDQFGSGRITGQALNSDFLQNVADVYGLPGNIFANAG